jgi:phage virion morphogenesis protein
VLSSLKQAAVRAERPRELWDEVGAALVVSTQQRFEDEEDPQGNPWPQSLRARFFGGRTLTDTASLVQSITHEASDDGVAVGTNVLYAAIHQTGGRIEAKKARALRFRLPGGNGFIAVKAVTMPRRAFLGLDEADGKEIAAIAGAYLGAEEGGDAGR